MRDARLVGLSSDARWLIIERDGEHLRVPLDDALRAAVRHETQIAMPLQAAVTPREVQRRIRAGETAEHIAEASGVAVDLIARFEGPVLDERRWQADCARRTVVDGTTLEERFAAATHNVDGTSLTAWDAWVDPDGGGWRVQATCPDGRVRRLVVERPHVESAWPRRSRPVHAVRPSSQRRPRSGATAAQFRSRSSRGAGNPANTRTSADHATR